MSEPVKKTGYKYKEYAPPAEFLNAIEKFWVFESASFTGSKTHFHLLSDYTTSLIFTFPQSKERNEIFVSGPNLSNCPFRNLPYLITIGVRFHPSVFQKIFPIAAIAAKNKAVKLQSFFTSPKIKQLKISLGNVKSTAQKLSVISGFLKGELHGFTLPADPVSSVIEKITNSDGSLKLEQEYSNLPISPRQFQRNFAKATGLTPKEFCRLVRFHTVTRKLVKNNFRHFDTLIESGYYDQSHYYREFREFLGMLPSGFESRQKLIDHKYLVAE